MKHDGKKEGEKKLYEKPKLTTIALAVDEVLFIGCKLASGGFAFGATPCPSNFCSQDGS
jgi:hypothetical protein